ncbi:hypothetical protein GGR53DRAFT_467215 [Hypoxylon sp. FL1150]|nr:hypothetical protein GGR53DRAFT_467215 [Hypoxylon sp. FL1150]
MQFKLLALSLLTTLAVADDSLSSIIDSIPDCALPCLAQKAEGAGCKISDFGCICDHEIEIAARAGMCLPQDCSIWDATKLGGRLGDLCDRWNARPSSTEIAAATSDFASQVSAASVAATATLKSAAGNLEPGMVMMGAAAAVAALVI